MASGINSTFRQVGIATGIALLGTLFSNKVASEVRSAIAAVPGLSHQGPRIATAVQSGEIGNVIGKLPAPLRPKVGEIARAAFTTGLDHILLVTAIIALVAAWSRWSPSAPRTSSSRADSHRSPGAEPAHREGRHARREPVAAAARSRRRSGKLGPGSSGFQAPGVPEHQREPTDENRAALE